MHNKSKINFRLRLLPQCLMSASNEVSIGNCIGPECHFYGKKRCMSYISGHDLKVALI